MPVKLGSKLPAENEARIEIIPLIDIMFFLLAAFMLVSLSTVHLRTVKVDLPTATTATQDSQRDLITLSVNKAGLAFVDQKPMADHELMHLLKAKRQENPKSRVFIHGDKEARHGAVIHVLDLVRASGIEKVSFSIREGVEPKTP